jgi:hypothetical protein
MESNHLAYIDRMDAELRGYRQVRDQEQTIFNKVAESRDMLQMEVTIKD